MNPRLTSLARLARKPAVLPFGKYKGKRLDKIVFDDPGYLGWCLLNDVKWVQDNLRRKDAAFCERSYHEREAMDEILDEMYQDEIMWRD